ncbi:MAG: hypothetical protein LBU05_00940 [Bifidobacteriaceae bacterium]|nr:hypothetical protein [Bifidobacteriaceae bacterium]
METKNWVVCHPFRAAWQVPFGSSADGCKESNVSFRDAICSSNMALNAWSNASIVSGRTPERTGVPIVKSIG